MITNDPIADFHRWDEEMNRLYEQLPVCSCCGKRILEDTLYDICDEIFCRKCLDVNFSRSAENYMEQQRRENE